ncbi:hypothetical protein Plhal304r1_c016g0058851 [Plasmopara halstedii]
MGQLFIRCIIAALILFVKLKGMRVGVHQLKMKLWPSWRSGDGIKLSDISFFELEKVFFCDL